MGPSMSDPNQFKHLNRQKHSLAYEKKHRTQISLDSKIKFKTLASFPFNNHTQTSLDKNYLSNSTNTLPDKFKSPNTKITTIQNSQSPNQYWETPKIKTQIQQNNLNINQNLPQTQSFTNNSHLLNSPPSQLLNSQSKPTNTKKIVLNNQAYQIDVDKMRNRRLKSKERCSNIITANANNVSKVSPFAPSSTKQSFFSTGIQKNVSSLELESQLNPVIDQTVPIQSRRDHADLKNYQTESKSRSRIEGNKRVKQENNVQKVRKQYFEEYLESFQSKQSLQYRQKVKQCVSQKKLLKAYRFNQNDSLFSRTQENDFQDYEIRSNHNFPSKKSENTTSSVQTVPQNQNTFVDLYQNPKKPLKLIKILKNKDQPLNLVRNS